MSKRDSFYDPLRPQLNVLDFRPYYEDRILVKRLPWPEKQSVLWTPGRTVKEGPQLGEVISCGLGNRVHRPGVGAVIKGISELDDILEHGKVYLASLKFYAPMAVVSGVKIVYSRVPPQEFEQDGEVYTFIFEEQHVLGIVE